jgi:hypothetical protein
MRQEIGSINRSFRTESGQALVEYVLILIVSIGILTTLTIKIFQPLSLFLQAYMGDYVECLLETGELPALGGETRVLDPESCESKFEEASLANGRKKKSAAEEAAEKARREGESGSGGRGGGGSYAGSSSRNSSIFSDRASRRSAESTAQNPKVVEISIGSTEEGGFRKPSRRGSSTTAMRGSGSPYISYALSSAEREKLEKEQKGAARVVASNIALPQKKLIVKAPAASVVADSQGPQVGIGDFLRYLLIGAIIIVLGLLIGGQAAKLAKGWEK